MIEDHFEWSTTMPRKIYYAHIAHITLDQASSWADINRGKYFRISRNDKMANFAVKYDFRGNYAIKNEFRAKIIAYMLIIYGYIG